MVAYMGHQGQDGEKVGQMSLFFKTNQTENDIDFLKTNMHYYKNYYQPIWKWYFFNFQPTLIHVLISLNVSGEI